MNTFENNQKRIAFLSIHSQLIARLNTVKDFSAKDHEGLVEYAHQLVEELFKKYPCEEEKIKIKKNEGAPY